MNAGQKTIQWLRHEQLKVDEEWSLTLTDGFTWWAAKNPQHIEIVGTERGPGNDEAYFIRVKTEMWQGVELTPKALASLNLLMSTASMAGPVYDPDRRLICFSSLVRVHDGIWEWMARLISIAAMLQIQEAHFIADQFASLLGAKSAAGPHPTNGIRDQPDELAVDFVSLLASEGELPSQWNERELQQLLDEHMQQPPALVASGGGKGLTVEFPYGDGSSLCQFSADTPHPRIGKGLFFLQTFPVSGLSESDGVRKALELNHEELNVRPVGYGYGSYCYRDGCISFNGFLPNLLYRPGLLPNLYFGCAARAQVMSARFTNNDWSKGFSSRVTPNSKSAIERLSNLFGGS